VGRTGTKLTARRCRRTGHSRPATQPVRSAPHRPSGSAASRIREAADPAASRQFTGVPGGRQPLVRPNPQNERVTETAHDQNGSTSRRVAHPTLILILIAGAQLMVVLDATIVNIALPSMARYFDKTQTDMTWAINA
jgi:hypothetical protein